jgi:hypothetical protein
LTKVGELGKYIFRSQHDQITQEKLKKYKKKSKKNLSF